MNRPTELDANLFETLADLEKVQPLIIYDGGCFMCENYVSLYRANKTLGALKLVNARKLNTEVLDALQENYNLDDGMIFLNGGIYHHGHKAVNMLAMVSSSSGFFNKVNAFIFKSPFMAKIAYPFLKLGRRILLFVMGRKTINR